MQVGHDVPTAGGLVLKLEGRDGGAGIPCAYSAMSYLYLIYAICYSNVLCHQVYKFFILSFTYLFSSLFDFPLVYTFNFFSVTSAMIKIYLFQFPL